MIRASKNEAMTSAPPPDQAASDHSSDAQMGKAGGLVQQAGHGSSPTDVEKEASAPTLPPPDQGVAAWVTVAGGFSLLFVSFGWITCTFYLVVGFQSPV